jgi:hypothetical protein
MLGPRNSLKNILTVIALVTPIFIAGCEVRARYYDAPHSDYHYWGPGERAPYSRWEADQHRQHLEYKRLKNEDRQAYWNWRHDHP